MDSVVQGQIDRLSDILKARRDQIGFRLGVGGLIVIFYQGMLGLAPTLVWLSVYSLLQLIETLVFSPKTTAARLTSPIGRAGILAIIAANTVVFGGLSLLWPFVAGPWGMCNGGFLIVGAMLNSVLTAPTSRAAFVASFTPLAIYSLALPAEAFLLHAGWKAELGLMISGPMLTVCAVKLWRGAYQTYAAEQAAKADAERRRAEAESAVAAKSAFVAMVSHELRTPISAILAGATELERISGGVGRSHARLISDAGAMMRTLLNDLLDLAKLDAGRMAVENVSYDFRALMADQMRFWRAEATKKNVALRLTGAKSAPGWVQGDPMRLRQILNNLLSNALKFTEHGAVTVSIAAETRLDGSSRLEIAVSDTGNGMTEEQIERLFRPFEQGATSIARTHGGTGLGLTISRELARMMGGDITANSLQGEGSCFTASVEVGAAQAVATYELGPAGPQSALSILVVDDHEINRRALSLMLEPLAARVTLAASGTEALAALALRPYDGVLMDVHMPEMDGRETVRRLRAADGPNRATPVIAVTGATEAADVQSCLAAGMNDWVAKPIDAAQLYNALARQLGEADDELAETVAA